ncbi:MAG: AI-2E family transporter [Negativicutes bacterium]|nr:AI-2E family transporter [Negativicutes bacterium]
MFRQYAAWLKPAIVLAGLYLLSQITAIYLPVIVAVVLSFILNPLVNKITRIKLWPNSGGIARGWAVVLTLILFTVFMSGVMTLIFKPFVSEFNRFVANLPSLVERIQHLTGVIEEHTSSLELPGNIRSLIDQVLSSAATYALALGRRVLEALVAFASQVVELVVVPVLTFYFLKDWKILRESFIKALPPEARGKGHSIVSDMSQAMSGYLHGQALVSVIIGLMVFSGMYLLGVDYPLVLGLLATLTETIPIIGPIIGATPAIFLAYLAAPTLALKVTVFFLIIHQIENHIVVPKIMGHNIDLHPVTVILALLAGGQLFGVVGMIMAVPVAALLKVLFRHLWDYD